jgi:hypothetical protein
MRARPRPARGLATAAVLLGACLAAAAGTAALDAGLGLGLPRRARAAPPDPSQFAVPEGATTEAAAPRLPPGAAAPDFTLADVRTGRPVRLADFRGRRPVVLVFGSLSCAALCRQLNGLRELHREYGRRAQFLFVYVSEAHAGGPSGARPGDLPGAAAARAAWDGGGLPFPCLLEGADRAEERAYRALPLRLVLVGVDGRVLADLGRGLLEPWALGRAREELGRTLAARRGGRPDA